MFSVNQKIAISEAVQKVLRETKHPELPEGEINFHLHVVMGRYPQQWPSNQSQH